MPENNSYNRFITRLQNKKIYPYLYLLPVIPIIIVYFILPFIFSMVLSFTNWYGLRLSNLEFIGIENFIHLFRDNLFLLSLKNSFILVILSIIIQNFFAFINAYILHYSDIRGSKVWRAIIFFPAIIAPVIVSLVWKLILSKDGLVNEILGKIGLDSLQMIWLGNPKTALYMVILVNAWQWTGYSMILYHAGLQNIPDELIEAAKIDGANFLQIIKKVILPLLTPIITIILVLNIIGSFKVFDVVYALTRGGPAHYSEVIATYIYYNAFDVDGPNDYGYATAIAMFLTIIIFIFSYLRIKFAREEIGE